MKKKAVYVGVLLLLFVLTTFSTTLCKAESGAYKKAMQGEVNASWQFDLTIAEDSDTPRGKVYLLVGSRKVLIFSDAIGAFSVIERADYKSKGVPTTALTACSGWWAGQGQDLYVVRRRKQLIVYIRELDEQAAIPPYRRLKVIPLP